MVREKRSGSATEAEEQRGATVPQVEAIPLARLRESPTNPRDDWGDLAELAASMQKEGLLQAIIVRPLQGVNEWPDVEIVAGARRYRAAKIGKWTHIPATVRRLDDKQAIAIQLTENNHRRDIHPLCESKLFHAAIGVGFDVASLAGELGRDVSYVYHRLQLDKLLEPIKDLYRQQKLFFGHALLLARLSPAEQQEILDGGMLGEDGHQVAATVTDLKLFIENNFLLDLNAAAFPKEMAYLVKDVGPCSQCSKRTGHNQVLWPEIADRDVCTDKRCFAAKVAAHADRRQALLERSGFSTVKVSTSPTFRSDAPDVLPAGRYREVTSEEAGKLPRREIKTAIVTDGPEPGREIMVHVPPPPAEKVPVDNSEEAAQARQKNEQKARRQQAINNAVLAAIANKAKALRPCDWRRIADELLLRLSAEAEQAVFRYYGWQEPEDAGSSWSPFDECEQFSPANWQRLCLLLLLAEYVPVYGLAVSMPDPLKEAAKAFEVDLAAARKQGLEDLKAGDHTSEE